MKSSYPILPRLFYLKSYKQTHECIRYTRLIKVVYKKTDYSNAAEFTTAKSDEKETNFFYYLSGARTGPILTSSLEIQIVLDRRTL